MAKDNWQNSGGGDFAIGTNWSTGVPVSSTIANINATGTYTVTSSINETVLAVTTTPTATLDLTGGNFTALAGTGVGANAGTIIVGTGAGFTVGGTVKNSGSITLKIEGELSISRDTILEGGGNISLSDNLSVGVALPDIIGGGTLTNVDNVISGYGNIGVSLVNEKNGVIDAKSVQLLFTGTSLTNAGLLESTTGALVFEGVGEINNSSSGVIAAFGADSIVALYNDTVSGGTLETGSGGEIAVGDVTLDGSNGHAVTNTGSVVLGGAYTLNLLGTIRNTGTIAQVVGSHIAVGTGGATLAGSGSVTLSDSNTIIGTGTSTTLTNQNTISGAGTIGGNGLLLANQGVIDATGTNPLIIDTGTSAVTNSGTLEATGNGELFVASNVTNTGHLIANNGTVIFEGAVSGNGTATVQGTGSIKFGSTTTASTTFAVGANGTVTFDASSKLTSKLSITGFTLGDTIDLADINFVGSGPSLAFSKGVLTVSDGTHVAKLNMIGSFTLASFHAASDGSGGTLITDPPAHLPLVRPATTMWSATTVQSRWSGLASAMTPVTSTWREGAVEVTVLEEIRRFRSAFR
jgi:hypothetical protein